MAIFKTDQAACYDAKGNRIPCIRTGQDGDTRAGKSWPDPRFEAAGETVLDRLTGLVWPRNAGLTEFPLSWAEAFEFVADMNASARFGLKRWRLPERGELFSLVSHSRINPAVADSSFFDNLFNGYYWTATPCARYPDQAWYIHLGGGRVVKGMIERSYMVWPVHDSPEHDSTFGSAPEKSGTVPGPDPSRFRVSENRITDRDTGLDWTRHADLPGGTLTWAAALAFVRQMNIRCKFGFSDWRLPHIRELESLTDMQRHSPAISEGSLFEAVRPFYWSSTTSVYEPAYAWTLYTDDGNIGVGYKPEPEFHVWPVRDGT